MTASNHHHHETGTMTGSDLIELREQLGLRTAPFGFLVLGNKGSQRTVNRWVRRLEAMDLLPVQAEDKIREAVRAELDRRGYGDRINHLTVTRLSPGGIARALGIGEQVVRAFLLAPAKQAAE